MPNWTDEQLRAIEARGSNILLSAAAGSGKTTVLVERVLRLIAEDGADVGRMLVVTFTRAAASDMRSKLSRQLSERAAAGDARCREQLLKLDQANLSTLHAFCSDFLRTNFESAGVDPAFRILDDAVNARLTDEALSAALEEAYAEPDADWLALDYGRGPAGVRAALEVLFGKLEERPDPEAWLEEATRCDEAALRLWQDELKAAARRAVRTALMHLEEAAAVPGCPEHYLRAVETDRQALEAMLGLQDYDEIHRALSEFKPARAAGRGGDPDAAETVKKLRDAVKSALGSARIRELPLLMAREDAQKLAPELRVLGRAALRARALYEAGKAEQSGLTYADLEHRTLRALKNPDVARSVREKYDYIFVDEYQDTSDLQEAIVSAVCRPDNRFMVGDVKQSIYRFRLAEPRLFLEKYAAYRAGGDGVLLPLTRNFRSKKGILDFVNMVFERAMTGGDSEIVYDDLARLNPGREDADGENCVEIALIDSEGEPAQPAETPEEAEVLAEMAGAEREGIVIAQRIRAMMAGDPTLKYRDFAILTRSKADAFSAMMPVMLAHGIPAYADGQLGYFDSVEISWLLSMLRLIANRRSDVALIAMLHSAAVGLTADELARIRIASPGTAYCDAAAAYAEREDDAIAEKLKRFFAQLELWSLRAGSIGLGDFVRMILDESGFYTYAGALPGGAQRQANLDRFVTSAANFDREISGSLTRFLQYTDHMRARGDGDVAHLLGENDNVVRMMSIHKSKGLEFRVVFGAQLAKRYRRENAATALAAHRDLGIGMSYVDPELRTRRLTLPLAAILERQRREDAAEEMRILYVLLTRAQEKLILLGSVKGAEKAEKRWRALSGALFASNSHLDLIMAARTGAELAGQPVFSTVEVIPAGDIKPEAAAAETPAKELFERITAHPDAEASAELEAQMLWRYPEPEAARRPLKLTASGLVRELEGSEALPALVERPRFLSEDVGRMTGAERGTAYHRCMQLLDLDALAGLSGRALDAAVARQLDGFANRRLLSDAQREAVFPPRLARFLESDVGLRLRGAQTVRREWPFNVMLRMSEALTELERGGLEDAEVLVQGTIDCCFIEDGEWVLLDYKTDRADDLDALRAHYAPQLRLYALALERVTGIRVRESLLCLISAGRNLEMEK